MILRHAFKVAVLLPGLGLVACHGQEGQPSYLHTRMWLAEYRVGASSKAASVDFSETSNSDAFVTYDEFDKALVGNLRLMMYLHGSTSAYGQYWERAFNSWRHKNNTAMMRSFFDNLNDWTIYHKCWMILWRIKDSVFLYEVEQVSEDDSFERVTISKFIELIAKYGNLPFDNLDQLNSKFEITSEEKKVAEQISFQICT